MKRIVITSGEPAGVGPEIIVKAAQQKWSSQLVVVGNKILLESRAATLNLPLKCMPVDLDECWSQEPGEIFIIDKPLVSEVVPGELSICNAGYVRDSIYCAAHLCLDGFADALVTAPVHKGIIADAGFDFLGHTEYLADLSKKDQVVMMLANQEVKVALVTTHIPLRQVPESITASRLYSVLKVIDSALPNAKIAVCGLNPHAGEGGHLGMEEIEIITPMIERLNSEGMNLTGPIPADTAFVPEVANQYDLILAMYHDQGLTAIKTNGFEKTVNVTLGLPFVRTSVDHGTALDLAGTGKASAGSLIAAIEMAIQSCSTTEATCLASAISTPSLSMT